MMTAGCTAILSNPVTILLIFMGVAIGIVFGSIPGLTATMAVTMFLPITYTMSPIAGIALLIGLYIGGTSGGLISAILLNIPGTPASVATCFDGRPMALKGEAPKALGVGIFFSFLGTIFGLLLMMLIAPMLAKVAIAFGPFEYCALALFSLSLVVMLTGKDMIRGLMSALTGVGVCMPIIMIVTAFAALVASGGAPRASIALGRGDHDTAEKLLGGSFSLQIAISLLLTAVLLLFGHNFLLAFGASENTIEYADSYLNIYALGTLFVELTLGMNAFITAQGFATTGMLTVLIGAVCNIVLDPLFIFGLNMGVRGAALATVLSQGISCVWVVSFLMGKKTSLRLKPQNMRIDMKLLAPCIALGLSTFIMQSTESIISVCFNSSLLKYGGDIAVGAMTILTSVMQFAMLPLQGLAQGAQPISSYNFGAKNAERVKQTFFALLKASLTYSVILWACIMLFPQAFAGIFTPDQELLAFTAKALRIYCGALFIFGIQIACQMTFVSIGNAPCSIIVAILRKFVLLIPLIFILPHILPDQTMAVYTAEPAADTLAVIFTMVMFGTQFKKALKKLNEA